MVGEAPEDPKVVAAFFAIGRLAAKEMANYAEKQLLADPGDSAWLEVLLNRGDVTADFAPSFGAALEAHGYAIPTPDEGVDIVAREFANRAIKAGLSPADAAWHVVGQFRFGEGPVLPRHVYNLDWLLTMFECSEPWDKEHWGSLMKEEVRRLAQGEPSIATS